MEIKSSGFDLDRLRPLASLGVALLVAACSDSSSSATPMGYEIVTVSGSPLEAIAGDAVPLEVVEKLSDGSTSPLASGATVTWSGPKHVSALPYNSTAASPLPSPGADATAVWLENPGRTDRPADLTGVLFVLDAGQGGHGSITVKATVSGVSLDGDASATLAVSPTPPGDATRGATVYGASGANCATCHGATAAGSPRDPSGVTYHFDGASFDYPAPGLDTGPGNLAGDPAWNAALLAMAARSDIDNGGLTLRRPMPDFLRDTNLLTHAPPTTQDFADIYAFLKTQHP
jgi:mono/diheme cytochrome c family protein